MYVKFTANLQVITQHKNTILHRDLKHQTSKSNMWRVFAVARLIAAGP